VQDCVRLCKAVEGRGILLGPGMHISVVMDELPPNGTSKTAAAFPAHNLQHTLRRLLSGRAQYGAPASSVVLLGAPMPMPECDKFKAPLTRSEALLHPEATRTDGYARQWRRQRWIDQVGRWVAEDLGVTFVDIAALIHTRPDATVGRFGLGSKRVVDCVHTCQPGPVDEFVRLVVHAVRTNEAIQVASPRKAPLRFFNIHLDAWVGARKAGLEPFGGQVQLNPRIAKPYLCTSLARWSFFLECAALHGVSGAGAKRTCDARLDADTRASLLASVRNS